MAKFLKKTIFWLFILLALVAAGYLGILAYTDANCTRGLNYLTKKYVLFSDELDAIKYQEYVYEDIANCDSLWLKKCTSDENLLFEYTFVTDDDEEIVVKEYKDGVFEDNYKNGILREEKINDKDKVEVDSSLEDFMNEK